MRIATLPLILSLVAALASAADDGKTITVTQKSFSDIYPAVWFSPSTGEVSPLKTKTEAPPAKQYEIWIEPRDPEFALMGKEGGFALLGKGEKAFRNPTLPAAPKLDAKLTHLMRDMKPGDKPVFYCKARNSTCLIMVVALDKQEQVLVFKWRPLTKPE